MVKRLLKFNFYKFISFGYFSDVPQRQLLFGYLTYIISGTILLCLPFSQKQCVSIIDNIFIAASAISTTGLTTVSVSDNYTFFGQIIILILIQLGGIGFMTLSSFLILRVVHYIPKHTNNVLVNEFTMPSGFEVNNLIRGIIYFTFGFELFGAICLFFIFNSLGVQQPIWTAIFHSISSFCTAGFGLYNDSFEQFKFHIGINSVIAVLSYAGGIGFIVLIDLWKKISIKSYNLTFTSRIIILITSILTIFGTLQLFFFEPTIQSFSYGNRVIAAFFQTMTAMTTVGFNTISISNLHLSSLMLLVVLMFFGASPSGTGGGVKSTTVSAVWAYVRCRLKGQKDIILFGNKIPEYRWQPAVSTFILYITILIFGTFLLTFTEKTDLMKILFECTSAIGTVGLSCGITGSLTVFGKIIITLLMYIGRVGVLTFGTALLYKHHQNEYNKSNDLAT